MRKITAAFLSLCAGLLLVSCISTSGARGLAPSAGPLQDRNWEEVKSTTTSTSQFRLFWLWRVTPEADFNEAIREAVQSEGGDGLINVRYYYEHQYWLVGTVDIFSVKGTVIRYTD